MSASQRWHLIAVCFLVALNGYADGLVIKKANTAPRIDGVLEDTFWPQAGRGELKEDKGGSLKNKAEVYAAYDGKNLYVAFKCYEKRMKDIKRAWDHAEERDNAVYNDDCVEVFLDPFSSERDYYHLIVNSAGVMYDAKNTGKHSDLAWNIKATVAARLYDDCWVAEMAIPFSDFGYVPSGGEVWRVNFGREQKPDNELSCLFPTEGAFNNPDKFGRMVFEGGEEAGVKFNLESLCLGGADKLKLVFDNRGGAPQNLKVMVNSTQDGKKIFDAVQEIGVAAAEKKEIIIPYQTRPGEQTLELAIENTTQKKQLYKNQFSLTKEDVTVVKKSRVWNVKDPLYKELFSGQRAGLAKEGAIMWFHQKPYMYLRPFALQYGLRYSYDGAYQLLAENNLHPIDYISAAPPYNDLLHLRQHKVRTVLQAPIKAFTNEVAYALLIKSKDNYIFLPAPECEKYYLEKVSKALKENPDDIWAVFAGDETMEGMLHQGIELFENKDACPYIREVDKEVRERYGFGKYGIPLSRQDPDPYRWIAYRRWVNEKMAGLQRKLYRTVKEINPGIHVISWDPGGFHNPFDFGLWKQGCDILTHQLYPRINPDRCNFGFMAKLLRDISGVEEIWPVTHVENYAASFTPEEVLELLSDVFRNGGTGLHYYLQDVPGARAKKGYMHDEYYGAPERWQIEMAIAREAGRMKKLKFPKADFAILYSCDSYGSQPHGAPSEEVECAYTFLGPAARSWFTFIDDNQVFRKEKKLNDFKAIYLPFAKYERLAVIEELEKYVQAGGVLISGDPDVFSFDADGTERKEYRERLFGVKLGGKKPGGYGFSYQGKAMPVIGSAGYREITMLEGTTALAVFSDGKPAITEHACGKGKAIYFAMNPFTLTGMANADWKEFFRQFQGYLGLHTGHDIWRFKFPEALIKKPVVPEGKCLTGNYIFWKGNEPVDICNLDTKGTYSYSLLPDKTGDVTGEKEIGFENGKLTNRKKAPGAGNVDCGIGALSDWVVEYGRVDGFDIIFDFKKAYEINAVKIFYSGQLPKVNISVSRDGREWTDTDIGCRKEEFTEDVLDKIFAGNFGTVQFLKIGFGAREPGKSLTLSEVEVWSR